MLDLDKIRARLDRDAVCHCGELIRHHSQLSGHTAVEMTDPSHEETHALLDEIERLRSEFAAAQPVVEWRTMLDGRGEIIGWAHDKGSAVLRVAEDRRRADMFPASRSENPGWVLAFVGEYPYVAASGPETGEAGKAAAVAAWRRVCGLEAANPGA